MTSITRYPIPVPDSGDVDGPSSATDNAVARFDGTTGKLIQNSSVSITDAGKLQLIASGSSSAGINLAPGTAPSSPVNGDMWTTTSGVYARINGVTQGPFESAAGSYQPASGDLTAIDALAGTSGFLKKTATDTWALDTNTYLTGNQSITVSGDATGSGTTSIALTLANSGVTAGTYNNNAAQVRPFTVDAKGRVTSIGAAVNIAIPQSAVTNLTTDLAGKSPLAGSSSIQTVGTIYTGNWNAGPVTSRYFYQWANGEPTTNLGSPTVSEMALFDSQFNNKLWFYDPTKFTFTYTMNGTDWITQSNSTSEIKKLVGGAGATGSNISIPNLAQKYRIDIRNDGTYVYTNALYMYFSTNSHKTKVHIWKKRDDGSWMQVTSSNTDVSSWPGHLYLPFSTIPWSTASTGGHYNDIRIEFTPTWTTGGSYDYTNISLINLEIWGGYPAGRRTIYNWDSDKNVTFPAALTATTTISGSGLAGSLLSSTNPLMDGAVAVGTSAIPSRQDHVHPVDTSRSPVAGSSSITTVGTIGSGTWQGSVVAGQYGGTGVANTGKTITVSGNTTIGSSTHTVAFATSGNTSVTLPTSGTLEVTGHTHSYLALSGGTLTGKLTTAASAAGGAGISLPHGTAPTSPSNGDVWTTTAGMYARINGSTIGPFGVSAGATWGGITGTLSSQTDLNTALSAKVDGPASATDNMVARFDGSTGKLVQNNTGVRIADNGELEVGVGTSFGAIRFSTDDSDTYMLISSDDGLYPWQFIPYRDGVEKSKIWYDDTNERWTFGDLPRQNQFNTISPTHDRDLTPKHYVDQRSPTGMVVPFAGSTAPTGWLLCDGSAVSRTTYDALYSVIGTTYGAGNGSTTFNVPDLRGRTVAGVDNMGGTAQNRITSGVSGITGTTLGAAGGDQRLHAHSHTMNNAQFNTASPFFAAGGNYGQNVTGTTSTSGAGNSQNVQPTMMLNYIIKT